MLQFNCVVSVRSRSLAAVSGQGFLEVGRKKMPLYEYRCQSCGAVFEVIQKFSDAPLTQHEGCGGNVEKLISPAALVFKGTGWYVTDYGRKNGKNGSRPSKPASETKSTPKPEPAAKPKAETKPA